MRNASMLPALLALLCFASVSCESNGRRSQPFTKMSLEELYWPFRPASMRIHPLTRVVPAEENDHVELEVRVEFVDEWGHTTKAYGEIRLDVLEQDTSGILSRPDEGWNIDLRDLEVNLAHYDDVTRTYLFKLLIPNDELPLRGIVRVLFLSSDDTKLTDQMRIRQPD